MLVHMDGARLFNAAASLGIPFADFTTHAGVDVLSLGATKNGAMGAEAIVVLNPEAVEGIKYLRKMSMQLSSKMRFVSAQILALLEDSVGLRSATHANTMAQLLRSTLEERIVSGRISKLDFSYPTESNGVFAMIDLAIADRLRQKVRFYDWDHARGEVRWMCSLTQQRKTSSLSLTSSKRNFSNGLPGQQARREVCARAEHALVLKFSERSALSPTLRQSSRSRPSSVPQDPKLLPAQGN